MKEFSAKDLINNSEFRELFMKIIFFSNKDNILNLIKRFDELYSQALQINTTPIEYIDLDYSCYKKEVTNIYISKFVLENDDFRETMLETYLHEKRHYIQHIAAITDDHTLFKKDFSYVTVAYFKTPITNNLFCGFGDLVNHYQILPHEEDAFYHSNLQLIQLIKELLKYSKSNKMKLDRNKSKRLKSIYKKCKSVIEIYDLNFYEEYKATYMFAACRFNKQLEKEKTYIEKIRADMAKGSLTVEEQIIAKIIEKQCFSSQEREQLKGLINIESIKVFYIKNDLRGKSVKEVCQYIINKGPIR